MIFTLPGAFATSGGKVIIGGGSMGLAPNDATYVTLTTNATLLNERVLTAGTGIALTDGGAGSTITVGVDATLNEILSSGSTTGGVDLEVTAGDSFILGENAATPWTPAAAKGCIWVKNDAPNTVWFTDDAGTDVQLGVGLPGDVVGPAGATDDNIATFDGATGKLIQDGGEKITDLLDLGGTRAMSGDLDMGTNAVTNVGNVDGRDVSADGSTLDTHVGSSANPHTVTLTQALTGGSTTSGVDLEVTAGDSFILGENAATPWTPAAAKGAIWVKNDTPNTLYFTDDAGTDFQLGAGGGETFAQTLALGNTTGGTDLIISDGDLLIGEAGSGAAGKLLEMRGGLGASGFAGGNARVQGGPSTSGQGGQAQLIGGDASQANAAGGMCLILAGAGGAGAGNGAAVDIDGGAAMGSGTGGNIELSTGPSVSGDAGNILLGSGSAAGGDIGVVRITNTALEFIEKSAVPGPSISATQGRIWVKSTTPNTLYFTDDAGTDHQLATGGDLVGPAGATDDNLVTFDGATGKLVQDGGEKITDLLDLGGTRAMSGDLDMGTNAVTNVGNVDGRDVSADGSTLDTHVAATNNPHSTTLTLALTGGSTTSGVDLEVTAGDSFILGENAATPWTPAAGKGCIWIKNDAPNTLYFTDDGGTDHQLATGGDLDGPAGATDDNIATFDGATGKLVQDGGEKITDLLDLGGTRAMSGDLDMGTNAVTNVGNVDGRDVSADGSTLDTHVAATNNPHSTDLGNLGTGTLAELNTAVTDATLVDGNLAAVLAGGSTSGGTDLEISAGDALLLNENAAVPWTPAAGKGAIWVKNATPNELYFTDDAGTDFQLGAGASALDSYSQVNGDNGTGSSNNQILRFDTETSSAGSDITYTDSATNGGYWAISTTGIYAVSASLYEGYSASNAYAINVASALSNTFDATHIRAIGGGTTSLGDSIQIAWTGKVTAGDEIWISVDPDTTWSTSVSTNKNVVTVTRVQ